MIGPNAKAILKTTKNDENPDFHRFSSFLMTHNDDDVSHQVMSHQL